MDMWEAKYKTLAAQVGQRELDVAEKLVAVALVFSNTTGTAPKDALELMFYAAWRIKLLDDPTNPTAAEMQDIHAKLSSLPEEKEESDE